MVFWLFVAVAVIGLVGTLLALNNRFLVTVPVHGGSLTEGVVGAPRFINPLLAISDTDRDLSALVYSGLLRAFPDGTLVPDLAEEYEISEDGKTYTVTLREDAQFHDGVPVTADDVIFTIKRAQDSILRSPRRANWEGVTVEKISDREVAFTLRQPYAPFIENLTLGILPEHIWGNIDPEHFAFSEFNISPVGSGPYRIDDIRKNASGVPLYYNLTAFDKFALGDPYIEKIQVRFYPNEQALSEALEGGEIDQISAFSPQLAAELEQKGYTVARADFPRIFGVFFNQNQSDILLSNAVREALEISIDRDKIIQEVLHGYGTAVDGPIPPGVGGYVVPTATTSPTHIQDARAILEDAGWERSEGGIYVQRNNGSTTTLSFSLSTSNVPELKRAAELVAENWRELGADIDVQIFESSDLNQNVIRPREYEALLFGQIIGREADLFAFWHSSQRNDPGLNISLYTNQNVDTVLQEARTISDPIARAEYYRKFTEEIREDVPAVFLYSPKFLYLVSPSLHGFDIESVADAGDRFAEVYKWYVQTDRVWKIFADDYQSQQ